MSGTPIPPRDYTTCELCFNVFEHDNPRDKRVAGFICTRCASLMRLAQPAYKQEEGEGLKPTNPKDAIGSDKIPFYLWPEIASVLGALAFEDGALKYGRANWRVGGVRFTIYYDAMRRHMNKILEGEWLDPDSGLPHIGHVLACAGIIADAYYAGCLDMDTNYPGGYVKAINDLTPNVARLKEKYKDRHPHHWTSKDVPAPLPLKKAE